MSGVPTREYFAYELMTIYCETCEMVKPFDGSGTNKHRKEECLDCAVDAMKGEPQSPA